MRSTPCPDRFYVTAVVRTSRHMLCVVLRQEGKSRILSRVQYVHHFLQPLIAYICIWIRIASPHFIDACFPGINHFIAHPSGRSTFFCCFAHLVPQALHSVLGPLGPLRHTGEDQVPQSAQTYSSADSTFLGWSRKVMPRDRQSDLSLRMLTIMLFIQPVSHRNMSNCD